MTTSPIAGELICSWPPSRCVAVAGCSIAPRTDISASCSPRVGCHPVGSSRVPPSPVNVSGSILVVDTGFSNQLFLVSMLGREWLLPAELSLRELRRSLVLVTRVALAAVLTAIVSHPQPEPRILLRPPIREMLATLTTPRRNPWSGVLTGGLLLQLNSEVLQTADDHTSRVAGIANPAGQALNQRHRAITGDIRPIQHIRMICHGLRRQRRCFRGER